MKLYLPVAFTVLNVKFFFSKRKTYNLERAVKIFKRKRDVFTSSYTPIKWSADDTSTQLVVAAFRSRGPWVLIITLWSDSSLIQ